MDNLKQGKVSFFGWKPSNRIAQDYEPGDPDFFLMEFRDAETGRPLGTLSRFAMHAIMRSKSNEYYSSDFPWHIRELAKSRCGGTAIFMNGPCGDIAPCFPWPDKKSSLERKYAEEMLDAALERIESVPFEPLVTRHWRRLVPLPVRKEVLENKVELPAEMPPADELPARKSYLEREYLIETLPFLQEKYRNGETATGKSSVVELGFLQLGSWRLVCYPGETFSGTAKAVAENFPGEKLVSVTEHGRTLMYLPPEAEYAAGGYEPICAVTAAGAEERLRQEAISLIEEGMELDKRPSIITKEMLRSDLQDMGVQEDNTLLVHSSYKSIGNVEGGPNAVLDVLMDYFRERGLLVFPALSYSKVNAEHPRFDVNKTPSVVGALAEIFRTRPGVVRSLHPTHSVTAFGKEARAFTERHECSDTPCAKGSPWWKLLERNAKILFIGTGIEHNTFCHGVDEWLEIPGMRSEETQQLEIDDGNGHIIPYSLHRHCSPRNAIYGSYETLFMQAGAMRQVHFGNALCYLLDCRKAVAALGLLP